MRFTIKLTETFGNVIVSEQVEADDVLEYVREAMKEAKEHGEARGWTSFRIIPEYEEVK
jgi:hypothetical protein